MKINGIKFILALALALLLGFICEIIAPEFGSRNWISFAVGFVSLACLIVPAMGINYVNAHRGVNIKVFAWLMVIVLLATNIIFSCFEYKVDVYLAIVLLLAIIGWGIIYGMYSMKDAGKK